MDVGVKMISDTIKILDRYQRKVNTASPDNVKTLQEKKEIAREERRDEIQQEKMFYQGMPTKQLVELFQSTQEDPAPSRAQAYKRAEAMVNNKIDTQT